MLNDEEVVRRRRSRESRVRQFLQNYWSTLFLALVIAAGLFLLIQRSSELDDGILAFLSQVSLSRLLGFLLILGATTAMLLRIRWTLIHSPTWTQMECPRCGRDIRRIHRTRLDRLIGLYVPVRRYSCRNASCCWQGLRTGYGHAVSQRKNVQSST